MKAKHKTKELGKPPLQRVIADHRKLFGRSAQIEVGRVCAAYSSLMKKACTDADFEMQLGNLSSFVSKAFDQMLWLSKNPRILKGKNRTFAVVQKMVDILVQLVRKLEKFEVEQMAKSPDRLAVPSELPSAPAVPLRFGLLQSCAHIRDDWPLVITRKKQHVLDRFKFVTESMQLGVLYYQSASKGKSFESKVASGLRDWIDAYRGGAGAGKVAGRARRARTENEIVNVARELLNLWFPPYWGQRSFEDLPFFRIARSLRLFSNLPDEQILQAYLESYKVGSKKGIGRAPKWNQIRARIMEEFKTQAPGWTMSSHPRKSTPKVVGAASGKTHAKQARAV